MLEIINTLKPFIEDNYNRINVRQYARIQNISPPTASKMLSDLNSEGLLKKEIDKRFIYYYANKESTLFIDFSRIFWKIRLKKIGLIDYIEFKTISPIIILFGSLSKAEAKQDSDVDLAIFTPSKKEINIEKYEKVLKRKIQIMLFEKKESVQNTELLHNILNGYIIDGSW